VTELSAAQLSDGQLRIYELEQITKQLPQVEMYTGHDFCAGVYARTLKIPAGVLLTGAMHKEESFFLVREGQLLVSSGDAAIQVGPGFMSITKPGEKRVGVALSDVVVTTFHANPQELRDEKEIWNHYTIPEPEDLLDVLEMAQLEAQV
jgi:mannose-6-phosphate isomerase-like protein (cupin superfamily)